VWRPSKSNQQRAAVRPGGKWKECEGVSLCCLKDWLARETVEGIFAVQGQE
jgi:hypothetical protein